MPQIFNNTEIEYHFEDTVGPNCSLSKKRDILKLKNNIIKEKCNKLLKNKLKKYKLRKDGTEDPDIIDMSKSFFTSLKIKSPNSGLKHSSGVETDDQKVKNYLFKMGKHLITNKTFVHKKETVPQDTQNGFIENNENLANFHSEVTEKLEINNMEIKVDHNNKNINAFDLLMNSRSKRLGSNSPGKDKSIDQFESEDIISRGQIKMKRHSMLQKMAEAKGRLENIEIEECKDECIKRKMDKRAKRLKKILSKGGSKSNENNREIKKYKNSNTKTSLLKTRENSKKIDHTATQQLLPIAASRSPSPCSIFVIDDGLQKDITISKKQNKILSQQVGHDHHKVANCISNEDEEFLKKLSPSIRKKENVLCYFQKIEKNLNIIDNNAEELEESKNNVIKVKFTPLFKNRTKRDKTKNNNIDQKSKVDTNSEIENSLDVVNISLDLKHADLQNLPMNQNSVNPSRNRKRKKPGVSVDREMYPIEPMVTESRPKRNIKKTAKYTEEYKVSSSDEELHIFTPKKKKNVYGKCSESNTNGEKQKQQDVTLQTNSKNKLKVAPLIKKDDKTKVNHVSKDIAPIFLKSQINPIAIEAKQKFLHSGMPDKIKKIISKQSSINAGLNTFPLTRHVQQEVVSLSNDVHTLNFLPIQNDDNAMEMQLESKIGFKHLLNLNSSKWINMNGFTNNIRKTLESIKREYPKFPVYRTFNSLKNKKSFQYQDLDSNCLNNSSEVLNNIPLDKSDGPNFLNWSEKYRATTTKDIIGNFEPIKELKKWLMTWKENEVVAKSANVDSDTSDFCYSDNDSTDNMKSINNLLIITGAVGSGKTSSVYAVASELAMKVIEVNASSKRTGKIMFQDLQEATQSHKVNRAKASNSDNSQNSQEVVIGVSQKKRKKKNRLSRKSSLCISISQNDSQYSSQSSQSENAPTIMSLILIDDADIVFEQDDGFAFALSQIIRCSKRPVIIVATSLTSPHLQKYLPFSNIVKMNRLMPRMLGTWLDILCLADCGECCPGLGAKLLEYFRGDIRRTINSLQFIVSSQSSLNNRELDTGSQGSDDGNMKTFDAEDESSNMSWAHADCETQDKMMSNSYHNLKYLFTPEISFLDIIQLSDLTAKTSLSNSDVTTSFEKEKSKDNHKENISELTVMADAIDSISLSDMICHLTQPDAKDYIASHPWFTTESNSVSETENMENYNSLQELGHEICFEYIKNSIDQAQKLFVREMCDTHIPGMKVQREKERIIDRHHVLTGSFSPSAVLDRRALATDYWATCRTICRIEKGNVDNSTKRKHRYCHYLKTQKVMCKNDSFDKLCDSLSSKEKTN